MRNSIVVWKVVTFFVTEMGVFDHLSLSLSLSLSVSLSRAHYYLQQVGLMELGLGAWGSQVLCMPKP